MINQVMIKSTKLFDLINSDYSKCPGNSDLSKKIVKCALYAHVKTGVNQNVINFLSVLLQLNMYTLLTAESMMTIFNHITRDENCQNEILDFITTFSMELYSNGITKDHLWDTHIDCLKDIVENGVSYINPDLEKYLDNSGILKGNEDNSLVYLLMVLKFEAFNILYVLTEN